MKFEHSLMLAQITDARNVLSKEACESPFFPRGPKSGECGTWNIASLLRMDGYAEYCSLGSAGYFRELAFMAQQYRYVRRAWRWGASQSHEYARSWREQAQRLFEPRIEDCGQV